MKLSDVIVAPETRDLKKLEPILLQWLAGRMPGATDFSMENAAYPRGAGRSHETILFDLSWSKGGARRSQGYVLRIKPSWFTVYPDDLFAEQYRVMKLLHDSGGVRVARPLWFEEDSGVLGSPFFVMEKVRGRVPVSNPPYSTTGWLFEATTDQRRALWENAVGQLAAMQLVPLSDLRFLEGPAHARDGLEQEWDKYMRFIDWLGDDPCIDLAKRAARRLERSWPQNRPEGMVWGDARIGNMMFDDNFDVVAVMDWEQPSLGGALNDLSWFTTFSEMLHGRNAQQGAYLEGFGTREETIALWERITGKSAADLEWYDDFTQLKICLTGLRIDSLQGSNMLNPDYVSEKLKLI
jgi:aminoglycoside phosphotransferase (APT) family kinase protein